MGALGPLPWPLHSPDAARPFPASHRVRDLAKRGDGFGEIALLRDVRRTATVIATEPTTLLVIGRSAFLTATTGNPTVAALADRAAQIATM